MNDPPRMSALEQTAKTANLCKGYFYTDRGLTSKVLGLARRLKR